MFREGEGTGRDVGMISGGGAQDSLRLDECDIRFFTLIAVEIRAKAVNRNCHIIKSRKHYFLAIGHTPLRICCVTKAET